MEGTKVSRAPSWLKTVAVASVAVLVGMALGPVAVSAATTAVQGVLVKNTSAAAVYVQPPGHTVLGFYQSVPIPASQDGTRCTIYTVPAGHWLVITSATFDGLGSAPVMRAGVVSDDNLVDIEIPVNNPMFRGSHVTQMATIPGQWIVRPGQSITCITQRDPTDDASAYGSWWIIDGYLTQKP